MSSKRDRDFILDELTEAARSSSVPRHSAVTSISDPSLLLDSIELQALRLLVRNMQQDIRLKEQELALQLQCAQQISEQHMKDQRKLALQLRLEQQLRVKNEHELRLQLNQEQQLRLHLEEQVRLAASNQLEEAGQP